MPILSAFAIYFVIWFITLFVVLPIGLRTQAEANDVVPGTVESAPARFQAFKVFGLTTLVSALIYAGWHFGAPLIGLSMDTLPRLIPNFGANAELS
jgi:predicted secreted protein